MRDGERRRDHRCRADGYSRVHHGLRRGGASEASRREGMRGETRRRTCHLRTTRHRIARRAHEPRAGRDRLAVAAGDRAVHHGRGLRRVRARVASCRAWPAWSARPERGARRTRPVRFDRSERHAGRDRGARSERCERPVRDSRTKRRIDGSKRTERRDRNKRSERRARSGRSHGAPRPGGTGWNSRAARPAREFVDNDVPERFDPAASHGQRARRADNDRGLRRRVTA